MTAPRSLSTTNRLIASLPTKDRSRLLANCEPVELAFNEVLNESGDRVRYVYFPLDGYISLITRGDAVANLEVGLVGDEGMHGISLALGTEIAPLHALVQGQGSALRMNTATFNREYARSAPLRRQLGHYIYVLMCQLAQSSVCSRFHVVEARLARWLLMTQDRAHSDQFHITHAFLAWMLGVRRPGVTAAANALQKRKLISYRRGDITVLDREKLEAAACACYKTDRRIYEKILGVRA
jgi:CRP-like cAMP-binding protein